LQPWPYYWQRHLVGLLWKPQLLLPWTWQLPGLLLLLPLLQPLPEEQAQVQWLLLLLAVASPACCQAACLKQ
jgi:hypothetical protein